MRNVPVKKILSLLACILICLAGAKTTDAGRISKKEKHRPVQAEWDISRQIQYSFTLQNTTGNIIRKAELWTYAPVKQTSTQKCGRIEASHPYQLKTDDFGNQILLFELNDLPPFAVRVINVRAELSLSDQSNPASLPEGKHYLVPEKYVESDDRDILRVAHHLKSKKPLATAEKIFHWLVSHIHYSGFSSRDRGALYALRTRRGDCSEFAYLFVALCRSGGIPARAVGGYVCGENAVLDPNQYHNWGEFYDSGVWKIADPQRKLFARNQSHYIAMRIIGKFPGDSMENHNRFRFKGEGLTVRMNS